MSQSARPASRLQSPAMVAGAALLGYLIIFGLFFRQYGDLRGFVQIGTSHLVQSSASSVIRLDPAYRGYPENGFGYDGQFAYYIALDPVNARYYVDNPGYRYSRILYPVVARLMALGNPDAVPFTLLLINLLAVVAGTCAIAALCVLRGLSAWLALVYAFYIGQVLDFTRDLNEILAYALLAVAILIFERWPHHRLWAAVVFALAGLGRETALVFPVLYTLRLLLENGFPMSMGRNLGKALLFGAASIVPALVWQGFLLWWLGASGLGIGGLLFHIPFSGLLNLYPLSPDKLEVVQAVIVPGIICLAVGLWYSWKSRVARGRVELWALAVNALLFVVMLPSVSLLDMLGSARVAIPVVMGAIYILPFVESRGWFYVCAGLWLVPTVTYLLNPVLSLFNPV